MKSEEFKEKYGVIIENMDSDKILGRLWSIVIQIRWLLTNAILVFIRDNYGL